MNLDTNENVHFSEVSSFQRFNKSGIYLGWEKSVLFREVVFIVAFLCAVSHFSILQTMSILEERLTVTEDKVKECIENQQRITLQIQPHTQ